MEKYRNAKNPPSIYTEWRFWSLFYFTDILAVGMGYLLTKQVNSLFHLSTLMGMLNYLFVFIIIILMIRKTSSNPEERYIKQFLYGVIMDRNNYHAL